MQTNRKSLGSPVDDDKFQIDEDTGANMYTFSDKVKVRMESDICIVDPGKPIIGPEHRGIFPHLKSGDYFDGRIPTVVRTLSLDNISDLLALLTAWYGHLTYQARYIATEKSEAKAQRDFIASHLRTKWKRQKKGSDSAVKDLVLDDYRYVKWDAIYEELHAAHQFLEAVMDNTKRDINTVSREITIQQVKLDNRMAGGPGPKPSREMDPDAFKNTKEAKPRGRKTLKLGGVRK